jgi:hypothetical protein
MAHQTRRPPTSASRQDNKVRLTAASLTVVFLCLKLRSSFACCQNTSLIMSPNIWTFYSGKLSRSSSNPRYKPDAMENPDKDALIDFVLVMMTPGYINNPFLKAKLVSVSGLPPVIDVLMQDSWQWSLSCWLLPQRFAL